MLETSRILFPVVESDNYARGIEFFAGTAGARPNRRLLGQQEIEALQLYTVEHAISCLDLPIPRRQRYSWVVGWETGNPPPLNGPSAHLAALVVAIKATSQGVKLRGWLSGSRDIWATGVIFVSEDDTLPTVQPVTTVCETSNDLITKYKGFRCSPACLFLCASEDINILADQARTDGICTIQAEQLRQYLQQPVAPGQKTLVAIPPTSLHLVLDALFDGLFIRGWGYRAANAVTTLRLLCGIIVVVFIFQADFLGALAAYIGGLFTDVLDGMVARRFHGTSEFGKRYDRAVDMTFNAVSGAAYIIGCMFFWGSFFEAIILALGTGGVMAISAIFVKPHSALAKIRSGWIRVVLLGFLSYRLGTQADWVFSPAAIVGAIVVVLALLSIAAYEIDLVAKEVRSGRRGWWNPRP